MSEKLDRSAHLMWTTRHLKTYIILMDYNSKEQNSVRNPALDNLRDIMLNVSKDSKKDGST